MVVCVMCVCVWGGDFCVLNFSSLPFSLFPALTLLSNGENISTYYETHILLKH